MKIALTVTILLALTLTIIGAYRYKIHHAFNSSFYPIGPFTHFNKVSGTVTRARSTRGIAEQKHIQRGYARLDRIGPIIAGLALLVAGSLSGFGINIAIGIIAFVTAFGVSAGATGILFYLIASLRWESEHGKQIIIER
jgi:hypothetical protein